MEKINDITELKEGDYVSIVKNDLDVSGKITFIAKICFTIKTIQDSELMFDVSYIEKGCVCYLEHEEYNGNK